MKKDEKFELKPGHKLCVRYSDDTMSGYHTNLKSLAEEIMDDVVGSDFMVTVDRVMILDGDDNEVTEELGWHLGVVWNAEIVAVSHKD
jgi:hypothetical protein